MFKTESGANCLAKTSSFYVYTYIQNGRAEQFDIFYEFCSVLAPVCLCTFLFNAPGFKNRL
jgi:hypothetical protein